MTKIIGRLFQFGIGKETTRGTVVAVSYWLPYMDLTIDEKKDIIFDEQAFGIIEDSVGGKNTRAWSEGSVVGNVGDQSFGLILFSLMGTLTSHAAHGGESIVYDNIFSIAETAQHQSLTFAVHDPASGVDYAYANGVVEKLDIDVALKQFVKFTASIKALAGASQSSYTPSFLSENHFVPQFVTMGLAPSYSGVRGAFYGTGTASSTTAVTAVSGFDCRQLTIGMTVVGTNVPAATTVAAIVSATAFTLSQATTGVGADFAVGFLQATCTASSTVNVTALSGITTTSLEVGMTVFGKFVPTGAYITAIVSSTAFTLSAATSGAASAICFGPAVVKLKGLKLSINQNVEAQDVLGSTSPADFLNKEFNITGQAEAIWQNETDFKTLFQSITAQAARITIQNTDTTIGTAANPTLWLDLAKMHITELGRPLKVKDLVYQTIKFRANYSSTDSLMLKAVLTNTVNGY